MVEAVSPVRAPEAGDWRPLLGLPFPFTVAPFYERIAPLGAFMTREGRSQRFGVWSYARRLVLQRRNGMPIGPVSIDALIAVLRQRSDPLKCGLRTVSFVGQLRMFHKLLNQFFVRRPFLADDRDRVQNEIQP